MKLETNRKYCKHAPALYDCAECQLDADQKVVDELSDKIGILEVENAKLKTKVYKTSPMYIWKLENSVDNLTKELEAKLPLLLTPDEASFLTVCFDVASGAQYGKVALDAPIRAKLRAIVEGA